jgi:DNA-binding LytR/AlgR family response regulator
VEGEKDMFFLIKREDGVLEKIRTSGICLLESFGNYCHIYTQKRRFTQRMVLKNFAEVLPITDFVRVHRNYVVNARHIGVIDVKANTVTVNGQEYPFSKKYKSDLLKVFSK